VREIENGNANSHKAKRRTGFCFSLSPLPILLLQFDFAE